MSSDDEDFQQDEDSPYELDSGSDYDEDHSAKKTKLTHVKKKTTSSGSKTNTEKKPAATTKKKAVTTKKATNENKKKTGTLNDFLTPTPSPTSANIKKEEEVDTVMEESNNTEASPSPTPTKKTGVYDEKRTIEEIYQKKTQLEHILLRPDTYIGSTEAEEQEMWVYDTESDMIVKKKIKYVPGLYKIVDEILVNAADNKIRDPAMTTIKVIIDSTQNLISIHNDGKGIPVTMHSKEKVYVPELIFGHLLTSSNYDDNEKKVTGGRNGYGAKLCNIFSTEFRVETGDAERGVQYSQVFQNNMSVKKAPKITSFKNKEFTRISFKPDLAKFELSQMDQDFESLIKKRVYDMAGCVSGVSVSLNGTKIPVKGFQKYIELYTKSMEIRNAEGKKPIIFDKDGQNERWQVGFAVSDGQFNQVSFVNSISTSKGGTHVEYIADQLIKAITPKVLKNSGTKTIKKHQIKSHMCIFVNCLIENPTFDSQTKETMTLRASAFGSTYKPSPKFIKDVESSGIIDNIVKFVKFKEQQQMTKADKGKMARRLDIEKLDDANLAGVRPHNKHCTLILTEGDSAKALVLSGLSVVGRDKYGVFPLRGKLLNVRDASNKSIFDNTEITHIKAILGLQHGATYTSVDQLRYGKLMIMTDQDYDGSHIKGLVINFIDKMFPSLLDIPGFLLEFITPIIKCTHKRTKQQISFFTIPEFETWALENNQRKEWSTKYYKGLGTSDKKDARTYFSDLETHQKEFQIADTEDRGLIDMAFSKSKVNDRKEWLTTYRNGMYIDHSVNKIKISNFVNQELLLFSINDNMRSIPSMVDGFKPGQRKVFFGCIKRGRNTEVKVAQLANYVAGVTQYHHGEASVASTIINMAQDYVGSNNVNLLVPSGQFGTRHEGGKAAASPRYLFTRLAKIARYVYHPDDDEILDYLVEENTSIEPLWYMPILPMVLINGADGIGTGWSTTIPNYNPRDIVDNLIRMMDGEEIVKMKPWYRGFKGVIEAAGPVKYTVDGIAHVTDQGKIKVTELPVRYWTENFKKHLSLLREPKDKKMEFKIEEFSDNSTDSTVDFTIELDEDNMKIVEDNGILKSLKLQSSLSTNNIVCFNQDGRIQKYDTPEQILQEFYPLRMTYYEKRKDHLLYVLQDDYDRLHNKANFIELILDNKLAYYNRKEKDIVADMEKLGLQKIFSRKQRNILATDDDDNGEQGESGKPKDQGGNDAGYDYLFSINIRGFTEEKLVELRKQRDKKLEELKIVKNTAPTTFWKKDLMEFLEQWDLILKEDEELARFAKPIAPSNITKRKRKRG
ncbi:DNA topoisomerase [Halteromyces radiatus]|uniref:DNA topoisomerase n=1 Tax=Halteromyces radiatus TaxID=101107 RepID=UPI00221EBA62|nr:DNA topoisomerase [Halteromyces radiatus]KAI8096341.1 DNA topoisomerase [Halteromyces radiatus]